MTTTTGPLTVPRVSTSARRLPVLAGFAFVGLGLVSSFLPGSPPASDASAATIASYFRDHADTIRVANFLGALGTILLLFWFGALWRRLQASDSDGLPLVAGVALAIGVALAFVGGALSCTAASQIDSLGEGSKLLYTLSFMAFAVAGFGIAAFIASVCIVNVRAGFLPAWTNYLGGLAAIAFLVSTYGLVSDANAVNIFGLIGFLAWSAWTIALTVAMLRWE